MALALKTQPFVEIDALMRDTGIKSLSNSQEIDSYLMYSFLLHCPAFREVGRLTNKSLFTFKSLYIIKILY